MDTLSPSGHVPVLLTAVLNLGAMKPGMRVIDATLGGGSYTRALVEAVEEDGRVMAFDWDQQAILRFRERATHDPVLYKALQEERLLLVNRPYSELSQSLTEAKWGAVDVIVADLGLSSEQLADPERGISFQADGPLDMRLNTSETVTAADIVNHWSEADLAELFRVYADEGEAGRIAAAIIFARKKRLLTRTIELAQLVKDNVVAARRRGRIHPATQVFQALRMAVNSEVKHLTLFLQEALRSLVSDGKLLIVTFHSGEDALVKRTFRTFEKEMLGRVLTKKPITPSDDEVHANPRSRSAKLRGIVKL